MGKSKSKPKTPSEASSCCRIFTLQAELYAGPVTEEFLQENPKVVRTIEMRGDQTLEDLHWAIFHAFDRDDDHLFEFQFGGSRPQDRKAKSYVDQLAADHSWGAEPSAVADQTTLDSLELKRGNVFYYCFDFGDEWWHRIRVLRIQEEPIDRRKKYPRITERIGKSPPQYPDWDEEEGW